MPDNDSRRFDDPRVVPKLYEIRPIIRAYLCDEVERIRKEEGEGVALDDCVLRSTSIRRLRSLARQNICLEPVVQPDSISGNYDTAAAQLTPAGARLVSECSRRCLDDGRIIRD